MGRFFLPRTFIFNIPNIEPDSVSESNLYLLKEGKKVVARVSADGLKIRMLPVAPYEENVKYKIVFDKSIRMKGGIKLSKNYVLPFIVTDGKLNMRIREGRDTVTHERDTLYFDNYGGYPYVAQTIEID